MVLPTSSPSQKSLPPSELGFTWSSMSTQSAIVSSSSPLMHNSEPFEKLFMRGLPASTSSLSSLPDCCKLFARFFLFFSSACEVGVGIRVVGGWQTMRAQGYSRAHTPFFRAFLMDFLIA